jgi:hypothetical protein
MAASKLGLNLDDLSVDSFQIPTADSTAMYGDSVIIRTVLGPTEAYSCGGTCGTCGGTDCWA